MRTKIVNEYITEALFELLKENELKKITVSMLIKKAGVCRSSFYRNYFLIEDVLRVCLDSMFDIIIEQSPLIKTDLKLHIISIYTGLLQARSKLTILAEQKLLYMFDKAIHTVCQRQMKTIFGIEDPYLVAIHAGSSAFLMRQWIYDDFKKTPEEIADIFINRMGKDVLTLEKEACEKLS